MAVVNHQITNNGLNITINIDEGRNNRTADCESCLITHTGCDIDDQNLKFLVRGTKQLKDFEGNLINPSTRIMYTVNGSLYSDIGNRVETKETNEAYYRRCMNGLCEFVWGEGFYPFNTKDGNYTPQQPVVFTLEETPASIGQSDGEILVTVTDGGGTYEYNIDGGEWTSLPGNGVIPNQNAGEKNIGLRDAVANADERYQSIVVTEQ